MAEQKLLLFRKWDTSEIEIKDLGLQTHVSGDTTLSAISLTQVVYPIDYGRSALTRFNKCDVHIVERLANKLMHFGKKYAKNTGRQGGKKQHSLTIIEVAFDIIHLKTGQNPVEVLVSAVEKSEPNEDTTRID